MPVDRDPGHGPAASWSPRGYFDAVSGLPPSPDAQRWLSAGAARAWADPLARHAPAARTRAVLAQSRARFASLFGLSEGEVSFAPNADVALATAVRSLAAGPGQPVLVSPLERLAVLRTLDELSDHPVVTLNVDAEGRIDPSLPALRRPASLLVVQAANREIGTRQDLVALAAARRPGTPLLVDATMVRHASDLPTAYDAMVLEAAVWGGPDGLAVVACRSATAWSPQAPATARDRFPGRVSAALAGAAAMTFPTSAEAAAEEARLGALAGDLARTLHRTIPDLRILGSRQHRVPYLVAVSLLYVNAEQLVDDLAGRGFAVHSGSACTSDTRRPSHVLTAIGALTHGNLRISLPPGCPDDEVAELADAIADLVQQQRRESGLA